MGEAFPPVAPAAVVAEISMSLDGYVTGPDDSVGQGLGEDGEVLHYWVFGGPWTYGDPTDQPLREATGVDKQVVDTVFAGAGAAVVGRRMYDMAEGWGDESAFGTPVFVLTSEPRDQRVVRGGTYTFVTDGVQSAIRQAKEAAGGRHLLVSGGASVVDQCLAAGLVDEIDLHVAPILLGAGKRLFAGVGRRVELEPLGALHSLYATHLRYRVVR
jgi:dihydrofolate reductase